MKNSKSIVASAVAGVIGLSALVSTGSALAAKTETEKCYGVVKAGKNDCQTSTNACAGHVKTDRHPEGWIFLPKGTCEKIVGASLTAKKA